MKVVSWNCNMAFRKKIQLMEDLNPDILIVQECEHIDSINSFGIHQKLWVGENRNKGVGIFSFNPKYNIELIDFNYQNNRWFVPIRINGETTILAVWAMNHRDNPVIDKVQPVYRTINDNKEFFKSLDLMMGDFNNNAIWDKKAAKKYEKGTFSDIKDMLAQLGFVSAYHDKTCEDFGSESVSTHIWRKDFNTTYHIDYCFVKNDKQKDPTFEVLNDESWVEYSDHYPIAIELDY